MKIHILLLIVLIFASCGGGNNQETKVETEESALPIYEFKITKTSETDRNITINIYFKSDSTNGGAVIFLTYIEEGLKNGTKELYYTVEKPNHSDVIYKPYSDMRYVIKVASTSQILEEGDVQLGGQ
jgi:hypothetical protein